MHCKEKALEQIGGFPEGAAVGEDIYVWMRLAAMGKVAFHDFVGASIVVEEDLSREGRWKIIPYPVIAYSAADAPPNDLGRQAIFTSLARCASSSLLESWAIWRGVSMPGAGPSSVSICIKVDFLDG